MDDVLFSPETAATLESSQTEHSNEVAALIRQTLAERARVPGQSYKIILLSPPADPQTLVLDRRVLNAAKKGSGQAVAWTRGHRYASSDRLSHAVTTADL